MKKAKHDREEDIVRILYALGRKLYSKDSRFGRASNYWLKQDWNERILVLCSVLQRRWTRSNEIIYWSRYSRNLKHKTSVRDLRRCPFIRPAWWGPQWGWPEQQRCTKSLHRGYGKQIKKPPFDIIFPQWGRLHTRSADEAPGTTEDLEHDGQSIISVWRRPILS